MIMLEKVLQTVIDFSSHTTKLQYVENTMGNSTILFIPCWFTLYLKIDIHVVPCGLDMHAEALSSCDSRYNAASTVEAEEWSNG